MPRDVSSLISELHDHLSTLEKMKSRINAYADNLTLSPLADAIGQLEEEISELDAAIEDLEEQDDEGEVEGEDEDEDYEVEEEEEEE